MMKPKRICTFHLGPYVFGVDVEVVQEVLVQRTVTRVPLAPPAVRGIINLRGQIVTAIDLRRRLELLAAPTDASPVNIVVRMDAGPVSFLVDRAGDVMEVEADQFERPPETLDGAARDLIRGAYKLPDYLVLLLDPERAAHAGSDESSRLSETE